MLELARHIERLVLRHNCVIVPGLGGFVTQYVPARYVEEENILLPPCRTVGFNPQLTLNDGLLVQSYMQTYDTSFPEAARIVEDEVKQLRECIRRDGGCDIKGIGWISPNGASGYDFTPDEAGVVSPELYGLDPCPAVRATAGKSATGKGKHAKSRRTPVIRRTEKNYTLSLNRELVNYAAAIAVAVVFYFLWATPVSVTPDTGGVQTASVIAPAATTNAATQETARPAATQQKAEAAGQVKAEAEEKASCSQAQPETPQDETAKATAETAKDVTAQEELSDSPCYSIVLASAITKRNAKDYSARLQKDGMQDARVYTRGRMTRVVCGRYPTREKAQQALRERQRDGHFADAWVMETK